MGITIKHILDTLTADIVLPGDTVDKLEYGTTDSIVKGIATAFVATQEVIEKAKNLGVNLIISHEGIFYSHWDKRKMLKYDPIYRKKCKTIEESKMAIFRFHDYIHTYKPDAITAGLLKDLKWQNYEVINKPEVSIIEVSPMLLEDVISYIKSCLNLQYLRYEGDLSMHCSRIGILVGYRGSGESAIPIFVKENLDLIIYGEGPEWETPEYVRDAIYQGVQKGVIVLGHAESEAGGMKYLAEWLQERFPSIPVNFISEKAIFKIL
ncbi:MAG TPA: Nif3-like dinuclear metal center hexameric protein [Clostridiaceae bacterium]